MSLKRRSDAGTFQFKTFSKKQRQILKFWENKYQTADRDIIIADGSIRSGKTIAMIPSFLRWSNYNYTNKDFIVAGKSVGALKRNVIKPMLQILEAWQWHYNFNRSENFIQVGSNTYYLFGANNESSQDVLQGLTAAGALSDEVALFPQSFVDQMIGRCSIDGSKIFMNCNPGNPFHYVKTEFIDKRKEKNILYLHFTLDDNLTLSEKIKERYKTMFSGVFYKRYILGEWVKAEGVIYDMFVPEMHVKKLEKTGKPFIGVDYGTGNPTVFLLAYKEDERYYFSDEYYYSGRERGIQKTDKQYAEDMEKFFQDKELPKDTPIIVDPSAASFITELKQRRFKVKKANNEVLNGIRSVQSKLEKGNLIIDPSCKFFIKELQTYSWDEKAQARGEDKPIKDSDHCADACRYLINTTVPKVKAGINFYK